MQFDQLDQFTRDYIEAALWSTTDESTPEGGEPLEDNYGPEDIAPEALEVIESDCAAFQEQAGSMIDDEPHPGHDFWLTRNGHGAGFWDGDYPEHGDALTALSKQFGEAWLYVGDDGRIYC